MVAFLLAVEERDGAALSREAARAKSGMEGVGGGLDRPAARPGNWLGRDRLLVVLGRKEHVDAGAHVDHRAMRTFERLPGEELVGLAQVGALVLEEAGALHLLSGRQLQDGR